MKITQTTALENQDFYYQLVQPDHFWFKARVDMLEYLLQQNKISLDGKLGLEIGCGNSLLSSQIEQKYNCVIDGVDLTNAANRVPTRGQFYQVDITQDQSMVKGDRDFIILFDILEHIESVPEFLNACLSYLKPGGYVLVNVPAHHFLYSRYDQVAGHIRRYTRPLLSQHLSDQVTEVQQAYWGFFFVPLLIIRKILLNMKGNTTDKEIYKRGFLPPSKWLNSFLTFFSWIEMKLLIGTNIGTSILAIYKKPSEIK